MEEALAKAVDVALLASQDRTSAHKGTLHSFQRFGIETEGVGPFLICFAWNF